MTEISSFVVNPGCGRINGLGAWDVFLARSHAFKCRDSAVSTPQVDHKFTSRESRMRLSLRKSKPSTSV